MVPEGVNFCVHGKSRTPSAISSWTAHTKVMKPGNWLWTLG